MEADQPRDAIVRDARARTRALGAAIASALLALLPGMSFTRVEYYEWIGKGGRGSLLSGPEGAPQPSDRMWIDDVHIVSPERLGRIEIGAVLIDSGRIMRVIRGAGATPPTGATIVSGHGGYLIPGLIDSHVHLGSVPGVETAFPPGDPRAAMVGKYFAQLPRSYLYFGYTTLVDLAVNDRRVIDAFKNRPLHPDVYDCGPSVPIANGYPMAFAPPAARFKLFPNFLYDPRQAASIPSEYAEDEHTPAAAVAAVQRVHGRCVKTYFERGFGAQRNLPVPDSAQIAQLRDAAHRVGLPVMIHANSLEAQQFAVATNVDVVAHGLWNWNYTASPAELPPDVRAVLDGVVEYQIGYQATVQVMAGLRANFDSAYLHQANVAKVIPAQLLKWFQSDEGQQFKKELAPNLSDAAMLRGYDGAIDADRRVVGYLAKRNAKLLFGTDTPAAATYGNLPGLNGYLEMQQLRRAGMSLAQILRAATIENARAFKLDQEIGTIEPGKVANLVLLRESPLARVEAYDAIVAVWVRGRFVARDSLAANYR